MNPQTKQYQTCPIDRNSQNRIDGTDLCKAYRQWTGMKATTTSTTGKDRVNFPPVQSNVKYGKPSRRHNRRSSNNNSNNTTRHGQLITSFQLCLIYYLNRCEPGARDTADSLEVQSTRPIHHHVIVRLAVVSPVFALSKSIAVLFCVPKNSPWQVTTFQWNCGDIWCEAHKEFGGRP